MAISLEPDGESATQHEWAQVLVKFLHPIWNLDKWVSAYSGMGTVLV